MNRMYSRVALLFLITAASLSSHANAVELDAFPCTNLTNGKRRYKENDDFYVCVNPTGDYASNYKITTFKNVTCKGLYEDNRAVRVILAKGEVANGQKKLNSELMKSFTGRGGKQAEPNGMAFRSTAYPAYFNEGDRRIVCQGTAEAEYTEPCDQQTYTLSTNKPDYPKRLVHGGFCVLGAKDATVSVSKNGYDSTFLSYTPISDLVDGIQVWGNEADLKFTQLKGNICEGGIFLQPSKKFGLHRGLDLTIETTADDSESGGVTICAFVEPPYTENGKNYDQGRKWMEYLLEQGFEPKGRVSYKEEYPDRLLVLCKLMSKPCGENNLHGRGLAAPYELDFEAGVDIGNDCPTDIVLTRTDGFTPYPIDPPVRIISQETNKVTIEVTNTWGEFIDKFYYSYMENSFSPTCIEEQYLCKDRTLQPFIIQCNALTPYAFLRICLQGTFLLDDGTDNAKVGFPCCGNIDDLTPTVCYHLEIKCETTCIEKESRRYLREIAA